MDRSFLSANIPDLVGRLTMEEKISLLAGEDFWSTVPIPRLNIPKIKMSDGPNGARGESFFKMTPAVAAPNATCLAATFSTSLVRSCAQLLAAETKARNAVCLLAPTINIQRSPLGGRAFESFSEDPTLSGLLAAAYVDGLQSSGVSATIKHFVANDQEDDRMGANCIISPRALREIYLRPFQIAQARSKPWAYMTAYSKINGIHCSENEWLIQDLLRKEWGHEGMVMSDWYGTYSVCESINAGCDLEMPGPTVWRGQQQVGHLIMAHKIDPRTIDRNAQRVLEWVQRCARMNEDLVYAPPKEERSRTENKEEDAKLLRRIGAEGIVLLKNEQDILPIEGKRKVAIIGPNAKSKILTGGGSALLRAAWAVTPWQGLEDNKPSEVELTYSYGCTGTKYLPVLDEHFTCIDGSPGFNLSHHNIVDGVQSEKPHVVDKWDSSDMFMGDYSPPGLQRPFVTELRAIFTSPIDGEYDFGLTVTGRGWLYLDDQLVVDNSSNQQRGEAFFGSGTVERVGKVRVHKDQKYILRVIHDGRKEMSGHGAGDPNPFPASGLRIGAFPSSDPEETMQQAVDLAKESDIAIVVVGLNSDWESEGYDRLNLSLPLRQNELVTRISAVNPNTVVVVQGGSAVSMPWKDEVKGIIHCWYGGNEAGNAIADILYGSVNPSGRLPISFPEKEEDIAAWTGRRSQGGEIRYEEGIWVGYRWHNVRKIKPLWAFGYGLSYTFWEYQDLSVTSHVKERDLDSENKLEVGNEGRIGRLEVGTKKVTVDEWRLKVSVKVKNIGKRKGDHSVHFYFSPPERKGMGLEHPQWTLQGFGKVYGVGSGKEELVEVEFDKYAISHWDPIHDVWRVEKGEWIVRIGIDSQTMWGKETFVIDEDMEWVGV
ncbi:hypothetical protein M231_02303 [Tremella mesenterica]|uniref:beta-glucosidase n=1 Tax=Tremella mesenterica TaxID=5217 RepID=A0A4Q1BRC6_TREME|nr:hypothetical protein M231_02303 [Tremella mesenterica]